MSPIVARRVLPLLFLVAGAAHAQGFELDLTEEKPVVPVEFRPTLAVLSIKAADADETSGPRARQLEAELLKQLGQGDQYQTVIEPSAAQKALGADFSKAEACVDYACFEGVARQLKVHRVMRLTVQRQGAGSLVTVYAWDPGFNEVLVVAQDSQEKAEKTFLGVAGKSQAQKDREFVKKMNGFLVQAQKSLATPNGKIVVDNDPSAVAIVDGQECGVGSCEYIAQRGTHTVKATAAGYKPFEQTVTVEPSTQVDVRVLLVALPIDPVVVQKPVEQPSNGLFSRPGLYIAVAGAIAAGVGIAFGQSAQAVKTRLDAGGDPVGVTRSEAKAAPTNAALANVLVGVGAAAVAGGVTWIVLTPTPAAPAPVVKPGTIEPTESVTPPPTGAMLNLGGSF